MSKPSDSQHVQDRVKLLCFFSALVGSAAVFAAIPSLLYSSLLAMIVATILSPLVATLERRGLSQSVAIMSVFGILGSVMLLLGFWGVHLGISEWDSFKEKAPQSFASLMEQLKLREASLIARYPFLEEVHASASVLKLGEDTKKWFVDYGPSIASQFLSLTFLVPIISFILLKDGREIQRLFFYLVPNRFFESFFMIITETSTAISNYIRAKLLEAILVGLLVTVGLWIVQSPSAVILGILAGVTNIIPYIGPIIGFIPGVLLATASSSHENLIYWVIGVYLIANVIDTIIIFPLVVGRLIKLHPLVLIGAVIIGQNYYGLLGMLISVPIAASLKVICQEIYIVVYEQRLSVESLSSSSD